jgi:hypothetical protein
VTSIQALAAIQEGRRVGNLGAQHGVAVEGAVGMMLGLAAVAQLRGGGGCEGRPAATSEAGQQPHAGRWRGHLARASALIATCSGIDAGGQ